jgi:hemoglobin
MSDLYQRLGGEKTLSQLVDTFYRRMQERPESQNILEMHPQDLCSSIEKLRLFLTGWLGGPPLYEQRFGHPRLRARHLPFKIGKEERDQWIVCMVEAFDELQINEPLRSEILYPLLNLANHMRNQPEESD